MKLKTILVIVGAIMLVTIFKLYYELNNMKNEQKAMHIQIDNNREYARAKHEEIINIEQHNQSYPNQKWSYH